MGSDFVKKIGPVAAALVLILGAIGIIMSYTIDFGVPEHYISKHDTAYYAQNAETMSELLAELREFVFPTLDGIIESRVSQDGGRVVIRIDRANFEIVRAVLIRDFDEDLFSFESSR
jgi:hypothetical protein